MELATPEVNASAPAPGGVDVAGWLGEGWRMFWSAPAVFALSAAIVAATILIFSYVPLGPLFVSGPLIIGYYFIVMDHADGKPFVPARLFGGFRFFLGALAANILIGVFTAIGFVFLILPGLVVTSWYMFTFIFVADRGAGFWEAMEASRKMARTDMVGFFLFYMSLIAINILGALCLVVGLFVSVPVSALSLFAAYRRCVGRTVSPAPASAGMADA
ncbi:MAG: hypothetical protein HZA04_07325 [Nitrospinae bacterium]|nr:hypothetical protein [Nitrospinota bacterium]